MFNLVVLCALVAAVVGQELTQDAFCSQYCPISRCVQRTQAQVTCPQGWIRFQTSCFYIQQELKNWGQAFSRCQSMNATLLTIQSQTELEVFNNYAANRPNPIWLGLSADERLLVGWEATGGMNIESLPWADKSALHGLSNGARCVGYFKPYTYTPAYVYYYDCNMLAYYACEQRF